MRKPATARPFTSNLALAALFIMNSSCGAPQSGPASSSDQPAPAAADLVILGSPGSVVTLADDQPAAAAVAVRGGRIAAVGSCEDMAPFIGAGTEVIALDPGAQVMPGWVDAHAHLYGLGQSLESVDLRGMTSEADAAAAIARAAKEAPAGTWVTGRGWDQNLWTPKTFPTARSLAAITDHPVAVRRIDGHALWANDAAMKTAGIGDDTPDPDGGKIVRDAAGHATGVFVDNAMELVGDHVPEPDHATIRRRVLLGAAYVAKLGITAIHDMGISLDMVEVYRELATSGELPIRVYGLLSWNDELATTLPPPTREHGLFELRGVKMFADGALGSRGAALLSPYSDDPDNTGLVIDDEARLERVGNLLADRGYQLAVHAIGDAGNRHVLDAFAAVEKKHPHADLRFRVEHAQVMAPSDIPRIAELHAIASMQPTHATSDMPWAEDRVGPERIKGAYAWRSVLDTGAVMAFGSDFPVERPGPLLGLYAAVTRQDADGKPEGGWHPEQRITLDEALRAFTVGAAYAAFAETDRGRLIPGMAADMTIVDAALKPDHSLLERTIVATIVGGRVVYQAEGATVKRGAAAASCK